MSWRDDAFSAATAGRSAMLESMLARGDLSAARPEAGAILRLAAERGQGRIVTLMLEAGVPVDCADDFGTTALMEAAAHGHLAVLRALIDAGAQVNAQNSVGWTALFHAAASNDLAAAEELLKRGARATDHDVDGRRPYDVAMSRRLKIRVPWGVPFLQAELCRLRETRLARLLRSIVQCASPQQH